MIGVREGWEKKDKEAKKKKKKYLHTLFDQLFDSSF